MEGGIRSMKKLIEHNQGKEMIKKTHATRKGKKAYRSPHLVVYGNLSRVTRGGGGTKHDPATGGRTRA
jgi:hypothetical protein